MTITTLDGALAGMRLPQFYTKVATPTLVVGRPHSLWYLAGIPGLGDHTANTAGGVDLSSSSAQVPGQIPHIDPAGGLSSYLARFVGSAQVAGTILLCDRIKQVCGNSVGSAIGFASGAQTITGGSIAGNRDNNGGNTGAGVQVALEISAQMGASAPGITTIGYTGDVNGAGQTGTMIDAGLSSAVVGAFHRFSLAAGDTGVKSVQSLTFTSTWTSGTPTFVFYRVLAALEIAGTYYSNGLDGLTAGFPQIFNGTVPFLVFLPAAVTAGIITAQYIETQG